MLVFTWRVPGWLSVIRPTISCPWPLTDRTMSCLAECTWGSAGCTWGSAGCTWGSTWHTKAIWCSVLGVPGVQPAAVGYMWEASLHQASPQIDNVWWSDRVCSLTFLLLTQVSFGSSVMCFPPTLDVLASHRIGWLGRGCCTQNSQDPGIAKIGLTHPTPLTLILASHPLVDLTTKAHKCNPRQQNFVN